MDDRKLTKCRCTIRQRSTLLDVVRGVLEIGGGGRGWAEGVARVDSQSVGLDRGGFEYYVLFQNRGVPLTWWIIGTIWMSGRHAFGLHILRIIFLG